MQPSFISCDWRRLPLWLCQLLVMIWGAATTEDNCCRVSLSMAFPSVSKSVPVSPILRILSLDVASHSTYLSFHSLLYQTTIHFLQHLALLKSPSLHSKYPIWDGWASIETVTGRSQPPSCLPHPIFSSLISMPCSPSITGW